ncbi:hypothetical protein [Trinickia dinghuensis]|uniref:Type II/III secretion system secretin-like domain-containing protein n=1 Tax=Trinickia dinghuensis TaxID=2291023 RepID=A0A3D8K002_9BURK|nr:hypothetical protein [Trinickia dinghuensis]RDU98743.1 hypothetical protein DWV00_10770 [Trinickia dinghuensis]
MTSNVKRSLVLAMIALLAGCGTVMERNQIRSDYTQGNQAVGDRMTQLRQDDQQKAAVVREINGVWLGEKTVKVSRDAELPAVFSQPIRFAFPGQPTLTVIADRISKIVGMPVRVSADALIPIEMFSAQRMGTMMGGMMQSGAGGLAAANGVRLPAGVAMPLQSGPIGQYAPSMSMMGSYQSMAPARSFIIDQTTPFGGTLSELLDQISDKFGVGWDYKDGAILISRLVTRTYQIASITDTNDVTATIAKTASTGDSSGGGGGGGGSSGGTGSITTQAGSASSSSDVSSKLSASVDVVKDLKASIEAALTPNGIGKYSISSSGVITVTDTREVQDQIRDLVEAENKSVGRQVRMRMQIVDLTATTNNDMGVDWSWVINQAAKRWNVNFFSPAGLPGGSTGFGQLGVIRNGSNGSSAQTFLQALASVGKVNIRKDETYTMLNNRPLSIANTENFIYPAQSTAAVTTANSTTSVPGVEPGELTTGTFLNMRASIQPNGSVIVQFSMDASLRGDTTTFSANGITLQYPQSTANQYQIYASVVNGETAVLAGLDDLQQQSTDKSLDGTLTPLLGGGISTSTTRHAVLVLLTPQIIEGVN